MKGHLRKNVKKLLLGIIVISFLTTTLDMTGLSYPTTPSVLTKELPVIKEINKSDEASEEIASMGTINSLSYTICFSPDDIYLEERFGFDFVSIKDCSYMSEIGKPLLPVKRLRVAVPAGLRATNVRVISTSLQLLPGTYTILPAQQPLRLGTSQETIISPSQEKSTYLSLLPYPASFVSLGSMTDLAGQAMVDLSVYPLRYLPLQKRLILLRSVELVLEGVTDYSCHDYLPESFSEDQRIMYEQLVKDMVLNPEDVALVSSPGPQPLGVEPGEYDYVIVTQDSWVSAFQPLANWKTQKGVPTAIVTTSWIYNSGGYSGTNVQKIRAFVQDVYTNWGTTYVLLGGDIDVVPCHYRTFSGVDPDPIPNDAYFADFDDDWICEVHIGRASVNGPGSGTGQIGNFINKILTYERNPPLIDYAKKAGLFGFDLDNWWTHAEQCKINIDNAYIPSDWTMTNVYDSHSGNHKTNVLAALNAGQNLANHADHSNTDCMGTGYVKHNLLIYSADMDALSNGNKQTILYSMGCDPAAFDVSDCIAEHFVQNSNGGGIAFIGNSRYGWYNYGTYDSLSMLFDVYFFKSLFQENLYHLGAAFSDHKNDVYQLYAGEDIYQYIYTELTLLGDPELPVWKENPATLVTSHPSAVPVGSSSFTIHVQTPGGSNVQNAYVCVWKDDEVYERGMTNSAGDVSFTIAPQTGGSVLVTVTKQNYLPEETSAEVIESNLPPYQPSSPNPANGATGIGISTDLSWTGGDPNPGDTVTYDVYFGTNANPSKVVGNQSTLLYDPGLLNYLTTYYWKIVAWDSYGEQTTGLIWSFTTKANSPPTFGSPSPANGSTGNPLSLTWSIPISDPDGNTFSWTIQCSNGQSNSGTGATNGTKSLLLAGLSYGMTYTVWVNATDPSGSGIYTRRWYTFATATDVTAPVTTISFDGTIGDNSWFVSPVLVTLTATDDLVGVDYTMYQLDEGSWNLYLDPFTVSADGDHTIEYYSVDVLGNTETTKSARLPIDQTPPLTTHVFSGDVGLNGWYLTFDFLLNAVDSTSGVSTTFFKIDEADWMLFTTPVVISTDGVHSLSYYSIDMAGNSEDVQGPFSCKLDHTPPEISLIKQQLDLFTIKFTAQASDATSGVASVEFYLDGQLQINDTQAPYEWTWTGIGEYSVTATVYDNAGNKQSQTMAAPYVFHQESSLYQIQSQRFFLRTMII